MLHDIARRALTYGAAILVVLGASLESAHARSWEGRMAPEVSVEGGMYGVKPGTTLRSMRGDVVLVMFWSTRCPKCQKMTALTQRLHERYKDQGLKVLGICGSNHASLRKYMRSKGYNFGVAADPRTVNVRRYGIRRYPAAYVVGRNGRIANRSGKLYKAIEQELKKPKPGATRPAK